MRTIARHISNIAVIAVAAICFAACSKSEPDYDDNPRGTVSIAHLKTLCTAESVTVTHDISITGYVAANDLYGEYDRAIVICDDSGGIEISVDSHRTAEIFPIAARITVHCTSLALGDYGGRITLGAIPTGEYSVDRIAEDDFSRYFRIDTSSPQAVNPVVTDIESINPALAGTLIQIENVTFGSEAGLAWCDTDPATGDHIDTSRTVTDRNGRTLSVRTITECEYRDEKIPTGYGTLRGILEYFNGEYSLRIANHQILFPSNSGE